MLTLVDLIAFRQAEASGFITGDTCPPGPECDDCPFDKQCDSLNGEPFNHNLNTLPEYLLSLSELRSLYPEYFI